MAKKLILVFILLVTKLLGFSQKPILDSIDQKTTPLPASKPIDSTFVTYCPYQFDSIFLIEPKVVDTSTFRADDYDNLQHENTIYSTLSNSGTAHKSMRFDYLHHIGFDMALPSFTALMQNESNLISYQSVLPYSEIRYLMTIRNLEQHFHVRFGRKVSPRLLISFAFDTDYAPATFINNKTLNNVFWVNAKYITKNERYGTGAHWYRNKLEMGENGGIVNDENYTSHTETDNSVIPVNLNSATNFIVSSGIGFEQYFNLLSKKTVRTKKETVPQDNDSIAPLTVLNDSITFDTLNIDSTNTLFHQDVVLETMDRKFTLGRICHSFSYLSNKLYYNETTPSADFYKPFDTLMNSSVSTDTTQIRAIRNSLKWSSLGYQKYHDDIPFYLYFGVTHGFYKVKQFDYLEGETVLSRNYNQLSVNGGVIISLFRSTRIMGQGELVTWGYQIGDFDLKGQWKQFIGNANNNYGIATLDAELKRQSANWFEESYSSNHFRWENDFKAATYMTINLKYSYKSYGIGIKQTTISNLIYFGTNARPTQHNAIFSIREAYLNFYQNLGRFELEGFASLQKSSNEEVVHLPLFCGQLKFGYAQPIFHKAATLMPSVTVRYFTKYYADAYMPATRTFYLQNEVPIGNFPFIDLALSIKMKKAHIFISYNNLFQLTGNYNSFIAPHYPIRNRKIFIGINWRLFN